MSRVSQEISFIILQPIIVEISMTRDAKNPSFLGALRLFRDAG